MFLRGKEMMDMLTVRALYKQKK